MTQEELNTTLSQSIDWSKYDNALARADALKTLIRNVKKAKELGLTGDESMEDDEMMDLHDKLVENYIESGKGKGRSKKDIERGQELYLQTLINTAKAIQTPQGVVDLWEVLYTAALPDAVEDKEDFIRAMSRVLM